MKLNHEYVRDILLEVEAYDANTRFLITYDQKELDNRNIDELRYAARALVESGFADGHVDKMMGGIYNVSINYLTWNGHELLDNIRDDAVWKETKSILSRFASTSLSIASNVAAQVITKLITG